MQEWSSATPSLLHQVRQDLSSIYSFLGYHSEGVAPSPPIYDGRPSRRLSGLLGHFTSLQINCVGFPFEAAGEPVLCASIINPRRAMLSLKRWRSRGTDRIISHPCNKSPSAIAVTIVAAIAVPRAAAIAGVRTYESVPLYADRYSGGYSGY